MARVIYPYIQLEPWETVPADSPAGDAFGRQRVSNPTGIFAYQHEYDEGELQWEYSTVATGTYLHLPFESSVQFSVPSAGDYASKQTRQYYRYQPGKSQQIVLTGVLADGDMEIVLRSNTTGAPVDLVAPQANWNIDGFGDTGNPNNPSGLTIDFTKSQIFVIDLQWLGVGRVRVGFDVNGVLYYAHEFNNANNLAVVYMKTANLPIRYETENVGGVVSRGIGYYDDDNGIFFQQTAGTLTTMKGICTAINSEGGVEIEHGYPFCADVGATPIIAGNGTPTHIISIRPKDTFNGLVNRGRILPTAYETYGQANPANWGLRYNGTITGGAWVSADPDSIVEYNITAAYTAGTGIPVECGYIPVSGSGNKARSGNRGGTQALFVNLPLTIDRAASAGSGIPLTIFAQGMGGPSDVAAALAWLEFR